MIENFSDKDKIEYTYRYADQKLQDILEKLNVIRYKKNFARFRVYFKEYQLNILF